MMMAFPAGLVASAALVLATSGCAPATRYMGISIIPGEAEPEVQSLARLAMAGDKQAQLDLGTRLEAGNGVPQDIKRAIRLYRLAASDSSGTTWIYSPPVGNGTVGRVIPVVRGVGSSGLAEARRRLEEHGL